MRIDDFIVVLSNWKTGPRGRSVVLGTYPKSRFETREMRIESFCRPIPTKISTM
jgi:hypothetical protein